MEVILVDKIKNLGDIGDIVKVRRGYARNYLIPYGKAKFATEQNRIEVEQRRAEYEKQVSESRALAKQRAEAIQNAELKLTAQVMEDGRLYGTISVAEVIALVLQTCGVEVHKQEIDFPEGRIRTSGSHPVVFSLHDEVQLESQLHVVAAQPSAAPPHEEEAGDEVAAVAASSQATDTANSHDS